MHRLPKIILLSLIFACIGITTEVIFTSLSQVYQSYFSNGVIDWALGGKTYLWMFFIYMMIPLIFKAFYPFVENYNIFIRAVIAVLFVYIIEFSTGFFLEIITGVCPWKYTEGLHLFGYIRIDYFPFWFVFALIIINVYQSLDKRLN